MGPNAWSVVYNWANDHVDVSNRDPANTVSVINGKTNTLLNNVPVGDNPFGITYNSGNGCVYAVNAGYHPPASVSVVDCAVKIPIPFIPPIPCAVIVHCPPLFVLPWMFAYDPVDNIFT